MSTPRTAIFAGTFDPVTLGHLDIVRRAARLFPRVVVCVARGGKSTRFSAEARVAMFREALGAAEGVEVEAFEGLVVEQARRHGACALIRGIRGFLDWDYEMQMSFANRDLHEGLETVFLPPAAGLTNISSSLVREVADLGGDVSAWVPPNVVEALRS